MSSELLLLLLLCGCDSVLNCEAGEDVVVEKEEESDDTEFSITIERNACIPFILYMIAHMIHNALSVGAICRRKNRPAGDDDNDDFDFNVVDVVDGVIL